MAAIKNNTVIGLTGGFASGKSSVAKILQDQGIPVVDADQVARDVTRPGTKGFSAVVALMGKEVVFPHGELDRQAIRDIVFTSDQKRKSLEAALHPLIEKASKEAFVKFWNQGQKLVIYEASLLIEAGRHKDMAGVLLVTSDAATQLERALKRTPTLTREIAQKIIAAQTPFAEKKKFATWVIENNGTPDELKTKVLNWLKDL